MVKDWILVNIVLEILGGALWKEEKEKIQIAKNKIELSLFRDDMFV